MKKILSIVLVFSLLFAFSACGSKTQPTSQAQSETAAATTQTSKKTSDDKKVLTVYFSWSGNTETC